MARSDRGGQGHDLPAAPRPPAALGVPEDVCRRAADRTPALVAPEGVPPGRSRRPQRDAIHATPPGRPYGADLRSGRGPTIPAGHTVCTPDTGGRVPHGPGATPRAV